MSLVPAAPNDTASLIGRLLMVGVRGASPDDPLLRADLAACREARCRAVILFDAHAPTLAPLLAAGTPRDEALSRSPRNILSPAQLRELTVHIRDTLGPGTIVAVDQEGGEVARLSPRRGFPCTLSAEAVGALPTDARAREHDALAHGVAQAGFNLNFAPCVDVAVNTANPIIAGKRRAYSSDPSLVATCAAESLGAHRRAGVRACLKHFPGHGSSAADSHLGFTDITTTWQEDAELAPYRALLGRAHTGAGASNVPFVMTGHLFHARLDPDHPASLSRAVTTGLLRETLGFGGAVVTDSLDMRAIAQRYSPEEACLLAFNAGADLLLDANNMPPAPGTAGAHAPDRPCPAPAMQEAIARAVRDGRIPGALQRIRESAARIDAAMGFIRAV